MDLQFPLKYVKIADPGSETFEYGFEIDSFDETVKLDNAISTIKQLDMLNTKYIQSLKSSKEGLYLVFSLRFNSEEDLMLFKLAYSADD